jgi:hypothetical protein
MFIKAASLALSTFSCILSVCKMAYNNLWCPVRADPELFRSNVQAKLKDRGAAIKSLCAHPGLAASNLQATTSRESTADVEFLSGLLSQGQSAEDGTLPLLSCICNADAESGDFYGPWAEGEGVPVFAGDPMVGPPKKLTREEPLSRDLAAQEAMWVASEAAVGQALFA